MSAIADHPLRYNLANEMHARPFPLIEAPATAAFLAIKRSQNAAARERAHDRAHLCALLDRFGAAHPPPDATHYFGQIGKHWLKWESHTEFVTYTAFSNRLGTRAFDPADFEVFPDDWLSQAPGERVTSALLRIEEMTQEATMERQMNDWFVPESLALSYVLDEAALIAGDFSIDQAGHMRFAVFAAKDTGPQRIGRIVQRLCEVETYKAMSMLGFARAAETRGVMAKFDATLSELMDDMTLHETPAEATLQDLLAVSSELEKLAADTSFRFGATEAYEVIVNARITVLREERFKGRQTFGEFMMRRYDPAMRTVAASRRRLVAMADRAMRAGELLRTRVEVERSAQNQQLLEGMNRRAEVQLHMQQTVEGLSVVAISYYAVNLVAYALYPVVKSFGGVDKALLMALVTLPVVGLVWLAVRRIRRRFS
ncbi:DUF3422 domain-containing protein [Lentibacter algarum]|uniref:DUF3422 family protein n=1 Tax=Lentibacter algarum TaxID=576131 RepID=UPI001C07C2C1|nr:DUF3422 domain-containing protein [Lentibacter algarum]MBU2982033.1 DUF3422 domain-containing protein [Lentibacter algarum]